MLITAQIKAIIITWYVLEAILKEDGRPGSQSPASRVNKAAGRHRCVMSVVEEIYSIKCRGKRKDVLDDGGQGRTSAVTDGLVERVMEGLEALAVSFFEGIWKPAPRRNNNLNLRGDYVEK